MSYKSDIFIKLNSVDFQEIKNYFQYLYFF
jgi:hypothetical protein